MQGNEEWFANKELFKMFQELNGELNITTEAVKQYNNIRHDLNNVMERLLAIE